MPSPTRAPPSPPIMASKMNDLLAIEDVDIHPVGFPEFHHLVVTTSKGVNYWTSEGIQEVFHSGSEGIVAAKKSRDSSGVIAVADSQVVVLHDTKRALEKSYRLKGTDGQVRLLKYANDSKSLFFTTTLQNSVQSFCIRQSKLLDPSQEHPAPPTCFALSPTSHLLLSASASPNIVYLQNLTLRTRPILLKPTVSSAAVVVASFHPTRVNIFLLGFADGTLACYDATKLFRDGGKGDRKQATAGTGHGTEIGYMKHVHASGLTKASSNPEVDIHSSASSTHAPSISAASFVGGTIARVVSVGADGKCCVTDFETGKEKRGKLERTWHVKAPATCLSVLRTLEATDISRPISLSNVRSDLDMFDNECMIAIGRVDGKVVLYDLEGNLLGEKTIDASGGRILDVEWMGGEGYIRTRDRKENVAATFPPGRLSATTVTASDMVEKSSVMGRPTVKTKNQSLASTLAASYSTTKAQKSAASPTPQSVNPEDNKKLKIVAGNPTQRALQQDITTTSAITYMNLFSPIKPTTNNLAQDPTSSQPSTSSKPSTSASKLVTSTTISSSSKKRTTPPPIPPRPTPRKHRRVSIRKTSTSLEPKHKPKPEPNNNPSSEPTNPNNGKLLADLRTISSSDTSNGKKGNGLSLFAPYMQKPLIKAPKTQNPTTTTTTSKPETKQPELHEQAPTNTSDIWLTETEPNKRKKTQIIPPPRKSSRKSLKNQPTFLPLSPSQTQSQSPSQPSTQSSPSTSTSTLTSKQPNPKSKKKKRKTVSFEEEEERSLNEERSLFDNDENRRKTPAKEQADEQPHPPKGHLIPPPPTTTTNQPFKIHHDHNPNPTKNNIPSQPPTSNPNPQNRRHPHVYPLNPVIIKDPEKGNKYSPTSSSTFPSSFTAPLTETNGNGSSTSLPIVAMTKSANGKVKQEEKEKGVEKGGQEVARGKCKTCGQPTNSTIEDGEENEEKKEEEEVSNSDLKSELEKLKIEMRELKEVVGRWRRGF
ncbi:MAG: hypothetical protein M1812_006060 [Candelaria pacifica]|nr:MAG: hypothetical protein M1812_006060 [Candelaria pacifica]